METSARLRLRIEMIAEQLQEEFGELEVGEHGCLMEAVEEWAVQMGDQLAREVMAKRVAQQPAAAEEHLCPQCHEGGRFKGKRKRRVETRRGPIHVSEPEYYCQRCRR